MKENENNIRTMPKMKKEAKAFYMNMNTNTHKRLNEYCKKEDKTKTSVVETAINFYLDFCYEEESQKTDEAIDKKST